MLGPRSTADATPPRLGGRSKRPSIDCERKRRVDDTAGLCPHFTAGCHRALRVLKLTTGAAAAAAAAAVAAAATASAAVFRLCVYVHLSAMKSRCAERVSEPFVGDHTRHTHTRRSFFATVRRRPLPTCLLYTSPSPRD